MTTENTVSTVQLPRWAFFLRLAQGGLSLLALALICYPAHVWSGNYWGGGETHSALGFYIFACVWSFVVLAYIFLTPTRFPKFYNKYAQVFLEFLAAVFWLSAFAYLASFTNAFSSWGRYVLRRRDLDVDDIIDNFNKEVERLGGLDDINTSGVRYSSGKIQAWWALCAVDSAVGAIIWLAWSATFALFALALFKEHKSQKTETAAQPEPQHPVSQV